MEEIPGTSLPPATPKRPQILNILCILTFVGSGMNLVSGLVIGLNFDLFQIVVAELAEKIDLPGMDLILSAPRLYFFLSAILYAGSITGAIYMFKTKKTGFHVYTISQILLLIAPMYFFKLPGPSILDLILTGVFIVLYSTQLKNMT